VIELILEEEVEAALGAGRSQRVAQRCGYRRIDFRPLSTSSELAKYV